MTHDLTIINTFVLYIGIMMAIGVYYYRRTRNMSDYFLGNRKLGAWVTSLSAEASDMSGWMLMGVPGFAYLAGLNAGWIAVGRLAHHFAVVGLPVEEPLEALPDHDLIIHQKYTQIIHCSSSVKGSSRWAVTPPVGFSV